MNAWDYFGWRLLKEQYVLLSGRQKTYDQLTRLKAVAYRLRAEDFEDQPQLILKKYQESVAKYGHIR